MDTSLHPIQKFILQEVSKHPKDIVYLVITHFSVSRTTALRHLGYLIKAHKIIKTGTTKQTLYSLVSAENQLFQFTCNSEFDEFEVFKKYLSPSLKNFLNENAFSVMEYGATEVMNNAKDHSKGLSIRVTLKNENDSTTLIIEDDGIGVFKSLSQIYHFTDFRETILELSKGKLTSDRTNHSGEGIFFTSRAVDIFSITANGFCYLRNNLEHDWTFFKTEPRVGTRIELIIDKNTKRVLTHVFLAYQEEDSLAFSKTDVLIDLAQLQGERLISRSQAQRVIRNLEKFTYVTLDFKKVQAIGQGFVDQIFRVYQNQRPEFQIHYINANPDVEFMIKRSLATRI
jgi:hypothetical protein